MLKYSIAFLFGMSVVSLFAYTDESHYSVTFGHTRVFRVFTPVGYDSLDESKRYPVIYYFHGCGGSYERSGTYRYVDYGLEAPIAEDRKPDAAYEFPNNADFENQATAKDVIIICLDGKIEGLAGCGVYFPSLSDFWDGNYYNFSAYIREVIEVVDDRYRTRVGAQFRAVTGLSMGGHMAMWVAATNPHLFSSASEFCHSPNYYQVGEPSYLTTVDIKELWRNFRGLPLRHSTTDRDYLRYYTEELFHTFSGAGFPNEYYLADHCHHAAARIDLQIDFHLKYFWKSRENLKCFSHINLYPDFEIHGYHVRSQKVGSGFIYLHDVTKNGLGLFTRKRLPWGNRLLPFEITMTTPAQYLPNQRYTVVQYSYQDNAIEYQEVNTDSLGTLSLTTLTGSGIEIGINGPGLQPPLFILTDTINENIYLMDQQESVIGAEVVNLSLDTQIVDFVALTDHPDYISILRQPPRIIMPPLTKMRIDSFTTLKGIFSEAVENTHYLRIISFIQGDRQDREQIRQVQVKKHNLALEVAGIKFFDGRTENLPLFKYEWNGWENPNGPGIISEGTGNGNGVPELGETFSIWIKPTQAFDDSDTASWHPVVPLYNGDNPVIQIDEIEHHSFNTGRPLKSAQMTLIRSPTITHPVKIPLQSEFLKVQSLADDCHRNSADRFDYYYGQIILFADGSIGIE